MAIGDKIPVEAIKKALAENPVLKWAVIGFVAIFAVEFVAREGIGLWKEFATAQATVAQKQWECRQAVILGAAKTWRSGVTNAEADRECGAGAASSVAMWKLGAAQRAESAIAGSEIEESPRVASKPNSVQTTFFLFVALAAIVGDRAFDRWAFTKKGEGVKAAALHQIKVTLAVVAFMFALPALAFPLVNLLVFEYPPRELFGYQLSRDVITGFILIPMVGAEIIFSLGLLRQAVSLATSGWRLLRKDAAA